MELFLLLGCIVIALYWRECHGVFGWWGSGVAVCGFSGPAFLFFFLLFPRLPPFFSWGWPGFSSLLPCLRRQDSRGTRQERMADHVLFFLFFFLFFSLCPGRLPSPSLALLSLLLHAYRKELKVGPQPVLLSSLPFAYTGRVIGVNV